MADDGRGEGCLYPKNSAISSSEKPTSFSLSLWSLFSFTLALRVRPLSEIAPTKRPGFCVYKAKRVTPIPKVTPSKNVSRAVDFISIPPHGNKNGSNTTGPDPFYSVAGRRGFEPRFTESESVVLPLNDLPISFTDHAARTARLTVTKWLGDKDSNLGSKIQNLASYH